MSPLSSTSNTWKREGFTGVRPLVSVPPGGRKVGGGRKVEEGKWRKEESRGKERRWGGRK